MARSLQIVIPAYNEERRIALTLERLCHAMTQYPSTSIDVIVVLNGCVDRTREVVEKQQSSFPGKIEYVEFPTPIGKGRAILEGFKRAQADYISFMDADGSVSPTEILRIFEQTGLWDCTIGSRHIEGAIIRVRQPMLRRVASRTYNFFTRLLLGLPFLDTQCGGKILSRKAAHVVAEECRETGWGFDVEFLDILLRHGFSVQEVPIEWQHDDRSKVRLLKDGPGMFLALLHTKFRNRPRKYKRVLMVQHHWVGQGTFERCLNLAKQIGRQDLHITLLAANPQKNGLSIKLQPCQDNPYVKIVLLPRFFLSPRLFPLDLLLRAFAALTYLTLHRGFELIHFFALGHPFNFLLARAMSWGRIFTKGAKIGTDWDDLWGDGYARYLHPLLNRMLKWSELQMPRRLQSQFMTTPSVYLASESQRIGFSQGQIQIIPNGCRVFPRFASHSPQFRASLRRSLNLDPQLTYAISIGNTYGGSFRTLIDAFSSACRENSSLRLLLAGDLNKPGRISDEIRSTMQDHASLFRTHISVLGSLSLQDMHRYLEASNFAILPMEDTPVDRARFPIRLGDYLGSGKLIVSNATGEVERLLSREKIGLLCPVGDIQAFANLILLASRRPWTVRDSDTVRSVAETQYSWAQSALLLERIYRSLLFGKEVDIHESASSQRTRHFEAS